jgi:cell division inhibitor SepF
MSSVMRKAMVYLGLSDEDYDDYSRAEESSRAEQTQAANRAGGADYSRGTTTIRPLTRPEPVAAAQAPRPAPIRPIQSVDTAPAAPVRVHVIEPIEFGDAQEIGDCLKRSQPTIITLTDVEPELARRLIDFCSGATYVVGGSMERVSKNVFLITPSDVEVPPEEKQRLRERGLYKS